MSRYAADQMTGDEYIADIAANRALDDKLERLVRAKAKLARALQSRHHEDLVDASIRQFCATAKARLQACADFDANRQFLVDHIERVTYNRYHVTIAGFIPVRTETGENKLPFRIEGKIDIAAIRSNSCRKAALAAMSSLEPASAAHATSWSSAARSESEAIGFTDGSQFTLSAGPFS